MESSVQVNAMIAEPPNRTRPRSRLELQLIGYESRANPQRLHLRKRHAQPVRRAAPRLGHADSATRRGNRGRETCQQPLTFWSLYQVFEDDDEEEYD